MKKILHVCAEFYPLLKTGGLADVTGALPKAQIKLGDQVRVLIPGFPAIKAGIKNTNIVKNVDTYAGHVTLLFGYFEDIGVYIIDAPHLYDRPGSPYHDANQNDYSDNYLRFALLGWIASELACGLDYFWQPDLLHCHDWHAGLTCAYLNLKQSSHHAKSVFTIHNLAYHGSFNRYHLSQIQIPESYFNVNGLEYHGQISYLKAGLFYADHITAVSPTYAKEITTPELGNGFEGLLKTRSEQRRLSGILNGIDDEVWNPTSDSLIAARYSKRKLDIKKTDKYELQREFNLDVESNGPLFCVISRLTEQKGLDLILSLLPEILDKGGQFILLGSGDNKLQQAFSEFVNNPQYSNKIAVYFGYNEELSHRIIAGADVFMMPSRFEPCGLTQLYALKYGTLPLVRRTGGLADTVIDSTDENLDKKISTGFSFIDCNEDGLRYAVNRAFQLWQTQQVWRSLQRRAMSQQFSWQDSARKYQQLYYAISRKL